MTQTLTLVLLAALGGLLVLGLGWLAYRVLEQRDASTIPMAVAYRSGGEQRWRRGTLRFVAGRLVLKGPGGLAGGPWTRGGLVLGVARALDPLDARELGREGLIQVPVTYERSCFELVLDEQHYTALRAWVEAVPPGWNSQVA